MARDWAPGGSRPLREDGSGAVRWARGEAGEPPCDRSRGVRRDRNRAAAWELPSQQKNGTPLSPGAAAARCHTPGSARFLLERGDRQQMQERQRGAPRSHGAR